MPWCRRCKTEYREGFAVCADCGTPLAGGLPEDEPAVEPTAVRGEPKLLISLNDVVEADRLEALIDSADIPVTRKYEGAGQYISVIGTLPHLGVDLYVPEEYLDAASELVQAYNGSGDSPAERDEPVASRPDGGGERRIRAWMLIIVFGLGTVLTGIALLWQFLMTLFGMLFR